MTHTEAINQIERLGFTVRVGLANSFRVFLRNISSEPAVKDLLGAANSRDIAFQILQRVFSLSKLGVDFRYLHRYDIALATYLWILSRTSFPELATAGADATASLPRTWWSEQVSSYILEGRSKLSNTASQAYVVTMAPGVGNVSTSNVAASGMQILSAPLFGYAPAKDALQVRSNAGETSVQRQSDGLQGEAVSTDTAQSTLTEPVVSQ